MTNDEQTAEEQADARVRRELARLAYHAALWQYLDDVRKFAMASERMASQALEFDRAGTDSDPVADAAAGAACALLREAAARAPGLAQLFAAVAQGAQAAIPG